MSNSVTTQTDNGIARIRIDDGKVNAMSSELLNEVSAAIESAVSAEAMIVLEGREGIFSAGFDMKTFMQGMQATVDMLSAGVRVIEQLLTHPRPVVTVCNGHAYPMGAFLMLAADVRFVTDGAWKIGMNEVAIGLTLPHFALELARHRLTPAGFARITTAPLFSPEEARQLGYVDYVVPTSSIDTVVSEELTRLSQLQMANFEGTKSRIHGPAAVAIRAAADKELAGLADG